MGWEEDLFAYLDDLEALADAWYDAERAVDLADRSRAAYREVTFASRLAASVGDPVGLEVRGVGAVTGTLERVAGDWCLVRGADQDWVVSAPAIATVHGASHRSLPVGAWPPAARLGIGSPLRRLADAGERCVVRLTDGAAYDVVLGRVGQDFVEATTGQGRVVLLTFAALAAVQSRE
jgi:hypothetical protein